MHILMILIPRSSAIFRTTFLVRGYQDNARQNWRDSARRLDSNQTMPRTAAPKPPWGNPLFLSWLGEWMNTAKERNSKGYQTYKKAQLPPLRNLSNLLGLRIPPGLSDRVRTPQRTQTSQRHRRRNL